MSGLGSCFSNFIGDWMFFWSFEWTLGLLGSVKLVLRCFGIVRLNVLQPSSKIEIVRDFWDADFTPSLL
jgi:hypothetical protein